MICKLPTIILWPRSLIFHSLISPEMLSHLIKKIRKKNFDRSKTEYKECILLLCFQNPNSYLGPSWMSWVIERVLRSITKDLNNSFFLMVLSPSFVQFCWLRQSKTCFMGTGLGLGKLEKEWIWWIWIAGDSTQRNWLFNAKKEKERWGG